MSITEEHTQSTTPTPALDHTPPLSDSIYQSAFLPSDPFEQLNIQASLYHSAIDPFQDEQEKVDFVEDFSSKETVGVAKEKKSLTCRERQFCAQLAINEVLLSISSRGEGWELVLS